jgi:LEA14-like dessication related protein
MIFHNPNPLTLQLTKLEYHLWLDRVSLAKGYVTSLPLIRNHQDQAVEIPFVLKTAEIPDTLRAAAKNGKHAYKFSGQALAGSSWADSPIRFESEDSLVLPQMPATRWAGLRAGADGQQPEFGLEITNPNNFTITLHRLQGQCELDELPYTWEFQLQGLFLAPQQTKRIFVPCQAAGLHGARDASAKILSGVPLSYWVQGELECTSPQGIITVVIHEKSPAGKKN